MTVIYHWNIFLFTGLTVLLVAIALIFTWHYVFGTSEWGKDLKKCTDIWQNTHNETLYYDCMNPLEKAYGAVEIPQYVKEIKFETCHSVMDIYNLTSYYKCIGI